MLNTFVLLGKVHSLPIIEGTNLSENQSTMQVECQRAFNDHGVLSDILTVRLWRGIAETCKVACHIGTIIAIKGRIEINIHTEQMELIAEKVEFIR
ncbi:MAG: single-stranded DNA-binding protein [Erysipelotrichaceae bacterium]|nr:single-stranded DNA-binding protein [Erysipelotrichaceae bacterium]MDY6035660.1 hypothetical protein [Bulleidia sp.]